MVRFGVLCLVAFFSNPLAESVRIQKTDFPRFAGILDCGASQGGECPGAAKGFVLQGLAGGEEIPDPSDAGLTTGGRVVVGFLDGKPFLWSRYAVEFPNSGWKWVVLNEVSAGDQNRVFLTLWRHTGASLDLIKVFPRYFPLALGETTVHSSTLLPDESRLVILRGEGADAGVRIQDYRFLRLIAPDKVEEVQRRTNRSEIPVERIMEALNADQPVEPVRDSTLSCEVTKEKAPSGGPKVRFTMSRHRVVYTKNGPEESLEGKASEDIDIWKIVKSSRSSR